MNKIQFDKKYKRIKYWKYIPLLEAEVKKQMDRVGDWMDAALTLSEKRDNEAIIVKTIKMDETILYGILLSLILIFLVFFNLNVLKIFA